MALLSLLTVGADLWSTRAQGSSPVLWIVAAGLFVFIAAILSALSAGRKISVYSSVVATLAAGAYGLALLTSVGWTMLIAAGFGVAAVYQATRQPNPEKGFQ